MEMDIDKIVIKLSVRLKSGESEKEAIVLFPEENYVTVQKTTESGDNSMSFTWAQAAELSIKLKNMEHKWLRVRKGIREAVEKENMA